MESYFFIGVGVDGINYYVVDIDTATAVADNQPESHFSIIEIEGGRLISLKKEFYSS